MERISKEKNGKETHLLPGGIEKLEVHLRKLEDEGWEVTRKKGEWHNPGGGYPTYGSGKGRIVAECVPKKGENDE